MAERSYYAIDEATARRAHNMMSFRDYVEGSLTHEYRSYVDHAYDIADEVAEKRPDLAERAYRMADRYSKRMADNLNKHSQIGCMCPSVMIAGGSNFPVHKKEKQNAADDRNRAEFMEIEKIPDCCLSVKTLDFSREKFLTTWDSTIKRADRDLYGWAANPWVWVIEFERISKAEALAEEVSG